MIERGERRHLRVGDRTASVYLVRPDSPSTGGVLVLHPWWGLNDDVIAYADRLAAATGLAIAAPDLFDGQVATTTPDAERLSDSAAEDVVNATVDAAAHELAAVVGDPAARLGALGFSFGAHWALWLPAQRSDIAATVVYYGSTEGPILGRARVPVLGHFAESDPYETDEGVAAFETTLRAAGREVEIHRYPGTGHWFAEPSKDAYVPAAAELAFDRTVDYLGRTLANG